jgi:serine/threonine protein phosphatase PrpC
MLPLGIFTKPKHTYQGVCNIPGTKKEDAFAASYTKLGRESSEHHRPAIEQSNETLVAAFSLFDGHGGGEASMFCSQHLHKHLIEAIMDKINLKSKLSPRVGWSASRSTKSLGTSQITINNKTNSFDQGEIHSLFCAFLSTLFHFLITFLFLYNNRLKRYHLICI